jgi:hypothetical protein
MNWDAIGAIAELLGAIGVIASLVYLATQIRQSREQMVENTRALQAGTYQDLQRNIDDVFNRLIVDPENRRSIQLGMSDYSKLKEDDAFLFRVWIVGVLHAYDNAFYQRRVGLIHEERWRVQLGALSAALRNPGVAQWWISEGYRSFGPEFVALVEEILAEEAEGADPTR